MNAWNQLYAHVLWPAMDAGYRGLGRRMREYQRLERLSPEAIAERQWRDLQRLLRHAYATCPFYRRRFDRAGLDPGRMHGPEELQRLPALTRDDLRGQGAAMRSRAFAGASLLPAASGGTTDTPVPLWRDPESVRAKHAIQEVFHLWAGSRPGDKVFYLWGARSDFPAAPSWRWRAYQRYVKREHIAASSQLGAATMEEYRQRCNRFQPRILRAYPTPLAVWADFLLQSGRDYHRPHAIVVTAEALLPAQRRMIERAFACPVYEHYGSREFGMIAAQCERLEGMHVHPAIAYVEREAVPGGGGLEQLLVTDLLNYGMPLIRYQINDCVTGAAAPCGCGRGFAVLPGISGRTADVLRRRDGTLVPGVALTNRVLQVSPGLVQTQIIQESELAFRLRYVPGPAFTPADLEPLRRKLQEFLGEGLHWEWEAVPEIPREANGKTRFCISRLPQPWQAGGQHGT
ncbi:MAG TPA: hypothetical protein VIC54_05205 [Terriglobales bacterium]|jgi:phenylacetate-CoA ligase